jgi:hypothetical protein
MRSTHHRRHTPRIIAQRDSLSRLRPVGLTQAPRHAFLPYFQFVAESANSGSDGTRTRALPSRSAW